MYGEGAGGAALRASANPHEKMDHSFNVSGGFDCRARFCSSTFQGKKALYILTLGRHTTGR
jgi:hypothetical protein